MGLLIMKIHNFYYFLESKKKMELFKYPDNLIIQVKKTCLIGDKTLRPQDNHQKII